MELKQFLELFNPLPGNRYIQITTAVDATTFALNNLLKSVDGELHLALYSEKTVALPSELSNAKFQLINKCNAPFRALPRDHDIVILKDIFTQHTNPELLLRIAYTTLANTADIIIMEPKGTMDIAATKKLLEKFEFRAPNDIEVIEGYDLLIAKKMHMWNNGL